MGKGQGAPCKGWFFTLNNYDGEDVKALLTFLQGRAVKWAFQEEVGEEGTPHLQEQLVLKKKERWSAFGLNPRFHWEKTRHEQKAAAYCLKEETRKEGGERWVKGYVVPVPLKLIEPTRQWQTELLAALKEDPDDRSIFWYYEPVGKAGKTQFTKWLMHNQNAVLLCGKRNDVFHGVMKRHEETGGWPEVVVYDVPRTNLEYVSYDALESIKNGAFFSGKYEGGQALFNSPHVVVFANEAPDRAKMSEDRWRVRLIKPDHSTMEG